MYIWLYLYWRAGFKIFLMSKRQTILAVDDNGSFLGYIPKETGHSGEGKRHLAITVLLFNSKGQVLLQRRKHKIFDNIWDFTASTHPLRKNDGTSESLEEATYRSLEVEYGIKGKIPLKNMGFFNYFAKFGEYCENEHDALLVGEYNGEIDLNPDTAYECKWVDKQQVVADMEKNPQNYSPWALEGLKLLKKVGF